MDGKLGWDTTLGRDRTWTLASYFYFLLKLGELFGKTWYIRTSGLEEIFFTVYRVGFQ